MILINLNKNQVTVYDLFFDVQHFDYFEEKSGHSFFKCVILSTFSIHRISMLRLHSMSRLDSAGYPEISGR